MGHLDNTKETYVEHLIDTLKFSFMSFSASVIFFIHGIFPDYLVSNGSNMINNLNIMLIEKKKILSQYKK
jgi:hypothetical protein